MTGADTTNHRASVIGGTEPLSDKALLAGVRKGLGPIRRFRFSSAQIAEAMTERTLVHHPLWLAKILSHADRPPFPPKVIPNLVFVDAVSGYRGVLETVPPLGEQIPAGSRTTKPVISSPKAARRYVTAVLDKVDRSYMLKKPRHEVKELTLSYLPLWRVQVDLDGSREIVINGNTGAPETYMASLWTGQSWLDI